MAEGTPISLTKDGPVATLTLNRPDKGNALDLQTWKTIPDMIGRLWDDDHAKVIILTGTDRHFSVGADIAEFEVAYASRVGIDQYFDAMAMATDAIATCPKPVIAAINGACFGGAVGLATACDIRIMQQGAKMAVTPAKLGIAYPFTDTKRLVDLIGPAQAKEMIFTALPVDAEQAHNMGLINQVADDALVTAQQLANTVADNAVGTMSIMKAITADIMAGQTQETPTHRQYIHDAIGSTDFAEGIAAFNAKRPPQFKGV